MDSSLDIIKNVNMIFFETITACNLRCACCPNSIFERGLVKNTKKMDERLFKKVIDELSKIGWAGEIQPHHCGEPLLDERIFDLLQYAKMKLPKTALHFMSNGTLLTLDIYQKLIQAGVTKFTVTQHGRHLSAGVREIIKERKKNANASVQFKSETLDSLHNWAGLIKFPIIHTRYSACTWPSEKIGIKWDGELVMCCWDYDNKVKIGNINQKSLVELWEDTHYTKLRNDIRNGIFELDMCKQCGIMQSLKWRFREWLRRMVPLSR